MNASRVTITPRRHPPRHGPRGAHHGHHHVRQSLDLLVTWRAARRVMRSSELAGSTFQPGVKMIPATHHGLSSMACISALQKCIRRGMEREAMQFAIELMHTSKAFHMMVCKRLEVICHEDVDTGSQPWI